MSATPVAAPDHPCLDCGACCATYRVSFHWAEPESRGLPDHLLEPLTPRFACMAGTNAADPRCVALDGQIGVAVRCTVYADRPSGCRELQPGEDKCLRARQRHALPPLAGADAIWLPGLAEAPASVGVTPSSVVEPLPASAGLPGAATGPSSPSPAADGLLPAPMPQAPPAVLASAEPGSDLPPPLH